MNRSHTPLTRRGLLGVALLSPALTLWPFGTGPEAQLRQALGRMNGPNGPASFNLVRFVQTQHKSGVQLEAVVNMIWGPGNRQRRVVAQGPDTAQTVDALINAVADRFDARA